MKKAEGREKEGEEKGKMKKQRGGGEKRRRNQKIRERAYTSKIT